jgi:hypothetical protein
MNTNPNLSVLVALLDLARLNRPANITRVSGRLGMSADETRAILLALEKRGLADATRVRLTLSGLALAVSMTQGQRAELRAAA